MYISKCRELWVPIWHSRRCKAFLIHMGSALEAIKKKGYFKAHKDANEANLERHNLVKQVKAHLAKLEGITSKGTGSHQNEVLLQN
jgi:hypothetical protein